MNWRRGLFRLWAALSGLWMVLWLVIGIGAGAGDALVLGIAAGDVFSGRLAYMITFLAVLFAPPVVLGIILLLAMWVAGAFTRPE